MIITLHQTKLAEGNDQTLTDPAEVSIPVSKIGLMVRLCVDYEQAKDCYDRADVRGIQFVPETVKPGRMPVLTSMKIKDEEAPLWVVETPEEIGALMLEAKNEGYGRDKWMRIDQTAAAHMKLFSSFR